MMLGAKDLGITASVVLFGAFSSFFVGVITKGPKPGLGSSKSAASAKTIVLHRLLKPLQVSFSR
jgi:hypothetical protein